MIATVALVSVVVVGSVTVSAGPSATVAGPSVNPTWAGGSTAGPVCRLTVLVTGALVALPSLSTQLTVRVGSAPALVGSAAPVSNVTLSSTLW